MRMPGKERQDAGLLQALREEARPLEEAPSDYEPLLKFIGDARFVLIGEASHGTHEFYRERARLTKRLIQEKEFTAVAVEADWPDAYRVNRYVRGTGEDAEAVDALAGFERFPTWMWRNADVLDFIGWLREHNLKDEGIRKDEGRRMKDEAEPSEPPNAEYPGSESGSLHPSSFILHPSRSAGFYG